MSMIKYKNRLAQKIDFTGAGNKKIHPTDIDAVLEFDNNQLVLFEVKHIDKEFNDTGQNLLLERIADSWQITNGDAFILFCHHNFPVSEDIILGKTTIKHIYFKGKYYEKSNNLHFWLKDFANYYNIHKFKEALWESNFENEYNVRANLRF